MKTVRRLFYRDIIASVTFVALAFLSLFYFIYFVDYLGEVGTGGKTMLWAALAAALDIPVLLYELLPIAVLIGTIYSLARMAQASEFTILRTGGLGPGRALSLLAVLGLAFAGFTFLVGDYLGPAAEREGVAMKARAGGGLKVGGAGAWLKEKRAGDNGVHSFSINIAGTGKQGDLADVRIFEFDEAGRLVTRTHADSATVQRDGHWRLNGVERTEWPPITRALSSAGPGTRATAASGAASGGQTAPLRAEQPVQVRRQATLDWPSTLTPDVVAAAVLPLRTMSTLDLWRYSNHLSGQEQASSRYEIQFWKKALYPFACLVMVALALPFAYLHARAGGVSLKVFGGIMLGIGFVLLNNVVGHMGVLRGWTPWVAAASPSLLFLALSLGAFAWLVRYR
jgi:lipopolysaccharide export system permease protein